MCCLGAAYGVEGLVKFTAGGLGLRVQGCKFVWQVLLVNSY